MTKQVYNFGAGPAMLPVPVMQQIQQEFLDFQGMGISLIELSHRSKEFEAVINRCDELIRELSNLPDNYKILYTHGGAQMQFAGVPLNLLGLKPAHKAVYSETGNFSKLANREAARYGEIIIASSSEESDYDRIPAFTADMIPDDASYAYITSNNTIYGTRYQEYPDVGDTPLAIDATSDIFSRPVDWSRVGLMFAGMQKNLGPSGTAVVIVREDLIGHALERTPSLLDYAVYEKSHSLANTNNTFAIYTMGLTMQWLKDQGGLEAIEKVNEQKAKTLYDVIDNSDFYTGTAHPQHRSIMNVTFTLPDDEQSASFLKEALDNGLYALKGHRNVGGIRASIYNAMPLAGCEKLAEFMKEFEKKNG
ncbi:MAG: 3-phosphoserine/phosphohydroxythreonine aminotransferase [Gammaproteobacteria bacterium]|nr:3-phosphoserine/phosphohydroxythreonine aminotransferase [Gammaproteobacteria bacterium]MAY03918.1 3-phosphoserine/phosphohydroxythreonine aminotransferase [Gammaproteobacteria bacterium]|tara:strand:- start:214 stop:1305 length:1092 start_codon:yes stop_codon:yes gene_type:complete